MIIPNPITAAKALWNWIVAVYVTRSVKATLSSNETIAHRLSKCYASGDPGPCPHLEGGQCKLCTCFVNAKARLKFESCPDNRWML